MIPVRRDLRVFAIEDTSAQLTWGPTGVGELDLHVAGRHEQVDLTGGPGCVDLTGLKPATDYRVTFHLRARCAESGELRFRTLAPPPGPELDRFATITDIHAGRRTFGVHRLMWDPPGGPLHSTQCAEAAIDGLVAWGAAHLIVKGDLVETSRPYHWAAAATILAERQLPNGHMLPVDAIAGNHELNRHGMLDPFDAAHHRGISLHDSTYSIDRAGLRVVLMNSTIAGSHRGSWATSVAEITDAVRSASAALLVSHHQPHLWPIQTYFPPGIPRTESRRFVRTVRRANPAVMGTSGHTHRHRRHQICGVPWTETGSPKDYPGTWTGYVVHEGGIRQVVRRVATADTLAWLDRTGSAVGGVWGLWSPGRLSDRCFTWRWPSR